MPVAERAGEHGLRTVAKGVFFVFQLPVRMSDGIDAVDKEGGWKCVERGLFPEWNRRIPILIENVRDAFNDALENKQVNTKKRKLFF